MPLSSPIRTAFCFAAGKGERMRPFTEFTPKPLLAPRGESMLAFHVSCLVAAGFSRIIVNSWYLAEQIDSVTRRMAGLYPAVDIIPVRETGDQPLETLGGICNALPHITGDAFLTVNTDMMFKDDAGYIALLRAMKGRYAAMREPCGGLLALTPREKAFGYDGAGDFTFSNGVSGAIRLRDKDEASAPFVYPGVQILPREPFTAFPVERKGLRSYYEAPPRPLHGCVHRAPWLHIGTPAALVNASRMLSA